MDRCRNGIAVLCALVGLASTAQSQNKKSGPEFTRQGLLIVNFAPGAGADLELGRRAGDVVRDRLARFVDKKQVDVIDGDKIRIRLFTDGFSPDTTYSVSVAHAIGRFLRADEFLLAHVSTSLARVPWPWQVEVLLDLPLDQAARRLPGTLAELVAAEGGTLLRMRVSSLDWMATVLARLDCPFTIRAPDELRTSVRALAERLAGWA